MSKLREAWVKQMDLVNNQSLNVETWEKMRELLKLHSAAMKYIHELENEVHNNRTIDI